MYRLYQRLQFFLANCGIILLRFIIFHFVILKIFNKKLYIKYNKYEFIIMYKIEIKIRLFSKLTKNNICIVILVLRYKSS